MYYAKDSIRSFLGFYIVEYKLSTRIMAKMNEKKNCLFSYSAVQKRTIYQIAIFMYLTRGPARGVWEGGAAPP